MNFRTTLTALAVFALALAAAAEQVFVATTTDFVGNKTFKVVTKEQVKEMQLQIKKENALLPKILSEIQNDFRKNPESHAGEKYYGQKLKPKSITISPAFTDFEKAQAKAEKLQEREDNKDLDKDEKKGKKKKLSEAEKEKAYKEAQKQYAIQTFAEDVEKRIEDKLKEAEAAK